MPNEDKNIGDSLVLDLRIWWRHVKTLYCVIEIIRYTQALEIQEVALDFDHTWRKKAQLSGSNWLLQITNVQWNCFDSFSFFHCQASSQSSNRRSPTIPLTKGFDHNFVTVCRMKHELMLADSTQGFTFCFFCFFDFVLFFCFFVCLFCFLIFFFSDR